MLKNDLQAEGVDPSERSQFVARGCHVKADFRALFVD